MSSASGSSLPPRSQSINSSNINNSNKTITPIKIIKNSSNDDSMWKTVPISSPCHSPKSKIQKTNSFSSPNRYSALTINDQSEENDIEMKTQDNPKEINKIPPIYIKSTIDFFDFCKQIKPLTEPEGFTTKSSSTSIKLLTYTINAYRQVIKLLELNNINYHTFQLSDDKAFRVVIRHLHHTTPIKFIKDELQALGFSVRSITNCLQYKTKNPLPIFFIDLEPSPTNQSIYKIDSICYTKIKVEAPHQKKTPVQCLRCQNYGHTRTYCHHTPRCVKCGDTHNSNECSKDNSSPATCALCGGPHPASYKGCPKYKLLQNLRKSSKIYKSTEIYPSNPSPEINTSFNQEKNFPPLKTQWATSQPHNKFQQNTHSNPNSNHSNNEPHSNNNTDSISTHLSHFLNEFKSLINPLISLLTKVIDSLLNK